MRSPLSIFSCLLVAMTLAPLTGCGPSPTARSDGMTAGRPHGAASDAPPLTHDALVGVWALTDARNSTFNVRLAADGHAVSTWSGGPTGAIGERGTWSIVGGRALIEWSNGWIDQLANGPLGIEERAWGPGDDPNGAPRTYGKAVQIKDATTEFLGVWQMRGVLPGDPATIYVAIQSDGMAFKSIGEWRYGCWTSVGRNAARITWANGWYDELHRDAEGYVLETWTPTADRTAAPSATNRVRRVE